MRRRSASWAACCGVAWPEATEANICTRTYSLLDLFRADLPERAVYVLGNETEGLSPAVAAQVDRHLAIPLAGGVESLNVACAASVVAFELARRRAVREH